MLAARSTHAAAISWTHSAGRGHCGETDVADNVQIEAARCCTAKGGSFKWPNHTLSTWAKATEWCLSRAADCPNAKHLSISFKYKDCSWYRRCPQLFAGPDGTKASFASAAFNASSTATCDHRPAPPATGMPSALDLPTLNRSLLAVGQPQAWMPLFARLASRAPITLAVLGSSVAQNAGCSAELQPYARCARYASGAARGFAVRLLERINVSWPHARHSVFSGGRDAMPMGPHCLWSSIPARTDLVVIEFGSMARAVPLRRVEQVVRMLLAKERPPFVVLLSVHQWCAKPSKPLEPQLKLPEEPTPWSALEAETLRVCGRYGLACVSVYRGLYPAVAAGRLPLERLTSDCLHFATSRPHGSGPQMVSEMLGHWFEQAQALWLQLYDRQNIQRPSGVGLPAAALPAALHAANEAVEPPTRCYAFTRDEGQKSSDGSLSIQVKRPIRWTTRAACGRKRECDPFSDAAAGCPAEATSRDAYDQFIADPPVVFFFCSLSLPTTNAIRRLRPSATPPRKISPGVLALVPGATLRAEVDPDVGQPHAHSGRGVVTLDVSYLTSHEGMGRAAFSCGAACSCEPRIIDAHHNTTVGVRKESVYETASLRVAYRARGACHLVIEVLAATSSGQHKFKLRDLVVRLPEIEGARAHDW